MHFVLIVIFIVWIALWSYNRGSNDRRKEIKKELEDAQERWRQNNGNW